MRSVAGRVLGGEEQRFLAPINGYEGACYMISEDPDFRNFTCFARCDSDADCDLTQDCVDVTGPAGPDAICLPAI